MASLEIYIANITKENNLMEQFLKDYYWNSFVNATISNYILNHNELFYAQIKDNHEITDMLQNRINNDIKNMILKYFSSYLDTSNELVKIKTDYQQFIDKNIPIICNTTINNLNNDPIFMNTLSNITNNIMNDCKIK